MTTAATAGKVRVAVLFGGRSVEHEVSIISGLQAFAALDRSKYEPIPLYIGKDGRFYTGPHMGDIEEYKNLKACLEKAVRVIPVPAENAVELVRYPMKKFGSNTVAAFDVALPVVHGTNVEDGTLMGYLETLGVPYAACDVLSSALGMDKFRMKAVLRAAGLPVLDAREYSGKRYVLEGAAILDEIEQTFGYPVIVKPVNLGSSVGISKAKDRRELETAMDLAFSFAPWVLVERAVEQLREINCAVLGDSDQARPSVCEEPVNTDEILSYQDKYLSGGKGGAKTGGAKSGGMSSLKRRCPADIPDELTHTVQELAVKTFQALGCSGVSRIDFLNDRETGELWVNEINTIPGSLAFYLWEAAGSSFATVLDDMIGLAFKRQRGREALTFTYETNILAGVSLAGTKGGKA